MDPLSIIAGIIAIVDSIIKTCNTIRDFQGLPNAFEEVAQNLPLVKETLEIAHRQVQQNNPDVTEKRAIEPIIKGCQDKAEALNNIFQKIQKKKEQNEETKDWSRLSKFYHNVVVSMGKGHRVETLMGDMMNKLKVLAVHQMFQAATQIQIEKLEKAIKELSQVEPSLPDSDFEASGSNVTQTINDRGSGAVCAGGSMENNWGNMFKADRDMNLVKGSDVGTVIPTWLERISTPLHFDEKLHELSNIATKSPGSGDWFLGSPQLYDWINGDLQKLWCYGIAGVGKSVITSIVVNYLQNLHNRYYGDHNTACIYVYFDYREKKSQTLVNVLSSLLMQLLRSQHKVTHEIEENYDAYRLKGILPAVEAYLQMIIAQAKPFKRIYMIVDALDECCSDTSTNMLYKFLQVCRELPNSFHILFTSRPGLNSQFAEPSCVIQLMAQPSDIKAYLDAFINSRPSMLAIVEKGSSYNPSFREFILDTVVNGSQGMFLLAHLHIGNLASTHTLEEFEHTLTHLADNLVEVYQAALDRISTQPEKQRKTAMNLLTWIVFAKRPLTVTEATQVLAIQDASSDSHSSRLMIPKASATSQTEWDLTSVCAGMVVGVVEKKTTFLHLAHSTAEQHLKESLLARSQDAHSTLTEVCLRCLVNAPPAAKHLRKRPSPQDNADHFRKNYPFFHYAANHWGEHLVYQAKGPVKRLAWDFLSDEERLGYAVLAMDDLKVPQEEKVTGLHIAAYFGLTNLVKKAISFQKHLDINSLLQIPPKPSPD
ncbi:hypothetical protein FSARC_14009 [Fusarium sarcochroum]|uniref:NACHT domain-containing protein n=1 Tax=Fusarium sarcochroum TaxID=1208366 RepID=A0A8H4WRM6_9HYPO|nr:hypothetical protein FSARC_14009 [Fusarium sarcochroum]